jgi:murein endopeptidase
MRSLLLTAVLGIFAVTLGVNAAQAKSGEPASKSRPRTYVVKKGEPLYLVAEKFGCSVSELREVNKIARSVKPGTELNIPGCGMRISKSNSAKGDEQVSNKAGKSGKKPGKKKARRIDAIDRSASRSQSVGAPWRGKLVTAEKLRAGSGYTIRRDSRTFGTHETVRFVHAALADFHDAFPSAHVVAVGDISAKGGGRISQHASHQSGRDIDLGFLFNRLPSGYPDSFVEGDADNLDLASTWGIVKLFLSTAGKDGGVQTIFLATSIQKLLYDFALENGEDQAQLDGWFQYSPDDATSDGIIRHEPNHADHFHIRFSCAKSDRRCR